MGKPVTRELSRDAKPTREFEKNYVPTLGVEVFHLHFQTNIGTPLDRNLKGRACTVIMNIKYPVMHYWANFFFDTCDVNFISHIK